jgi:hypothetical protein
MQTRITNILENFKMESRFEVTLSDSSLYRMDFSKTEEIITNEKTKVHDFLQKSINT